MSRVLVVATSRKTRGGITSVVKAHETGEQWQKFHCVWIETHRDGPAWRKIAYFIWACIEYLFLLPFADIVHIHVGLETSITRKNFFAVLAKECFYCGKSNRRKIIVHFHPSNENVFRDEKYYQRLKSLFDKADKILVLSPVWKTSIQQAYPSSKYDMEVLWNPCPKVNRNVGNKKKQILYAGTILRRKGYDVLLRAFGKIVIKYPDWCLAFAGNPYYEDGINELIEGKKIADELDISNQVSWLGWVSGAEKEKVFNESSIYCLASDGEGFPMGVLDAWAYGIPCVMTPVGGIPDIVKDGVNGLLFPIGDVDALSVQLERLMADDDFRARIVRNSDKLVSSTFCIDNINKQLESVYEDMMLA